LNIKNQERDKKKAGVPMTDRCPERIQTDGRHEWMPYRWVKEGEVNTYGPANMTFNVRNTVMKLGEVICKYCLEKRAI
jgi:hypothetical protein